MPETYQSNERRAYRSIGFNDTIDSKGEIFSILGDYRRLKLLP